MSQAMPPIPVPQKHSLTKQRRHTHSPPPSSIQDGHNSTSRKRKRRASPPSNSDSEDSEDSSESGGSKSNDDDEFEFEEDDTATQVMELCTSHKPEIEVDIDIQLPYHPTVLAKDSHLITCHHLQMPSKSLATILELHSNMAWPALQQIILQNCETFGFHQIQHGVSDKFHIAKQLRQIDAFQQHTKCTIHHHKVDCTCLEDQEIIAFIHNLAFPSRSRATQRLHSHNIIRGTTLQDDHFATGVEIPFIKACMENFTVDFWPNYSYQPYFRSLSAHIPNKILCTGAMALPQTRRTVHTQRKLTINTKGGEKTTITTTNTSALQITLQ